MKEGDYKVIIAEEAGEVVVVEWRFIEELNKLQQDIGLTFANKLKQKHLDWAKHKMNVKLAAQTLSESVACAINFLRDDIGLAAFQNSEATTGFIRRIDQAFDFLNSKNPFSTGSKAPVTRQPCATVY